jgi:hypothetical protein
MGGTLTVDSRLNEGSAFTLSVPVRVLDAHEAAVVEAAAAANAAALLLAERQLAERDAAAAAAAAATMATPQPGEKRPRKATSRVRRLRFHVLVAVRALVVGVASSESRADARAAWLRLRLTRTIIRCVRYIANRGSCVRAACCRLAGCRLRCCVVSSSSTSGSSQDFCSCKTST